VRGLDLAALERKREAALADLIEARQADFGKGRVTHSGATADATSRFLLLEQLCADAIELTDEGERRPARRKVSTPRADQTLDL
jgi:hypothetical protein